MPLTDTHIRSLKPDVKPRKYFDGGGLFLFIPANGSKLWRMAYRFDGKSKLLSFGEYPTVSLKDARERREENKFAALLAAICARIGSRKAKVKAGFLPPFFVSSVVVWGMAESACAGA